MKKSIVAIVMLVLCLPVAADQTLRLSPMRSSVRNVVRVPVDLQSGVPTTDHQDRAGGPGVRIPIVGAVDLRH